MEKMCLATDKIVRKPLFLRPKRPFFAKQAAYAHVYARKGFFEREIEKNLTFRKFFGT